MTRDVKNTFSRLDSTGFFAFKSALFAYSRLRFIFMCKGKSQHAVLPIKSTRTAMNAPLHATEQERSFESFLRERIGIKKNACEPLLWILIGWKGEGSLVIGGSEMELL